jgi:hypothetical protein
MRARHAHLGRAEGGASGRKKERDQKGRWKERERGRKGKSGKHREKERERDCVYMTERECVCGKRDKEEEKRTKREIDKSDTNEQELSMCLLFTLSHFDRMSGSYRT